MRGKNEFGFEHNATESRLVAKRMSEIFSSYFQDFGLIKPDLLQKILKFKTEFN